MKEYGKVKKLNNLNEFKKITEKFSSLILKSFEKFIYSDV